MANIIVNVLFWGLFIAAGIVAAITEWVHEKDRAKRATTMCPINCTCKGQKNGN